MSIHPGLIALAASSYVEQYGDCNRAAVFLNFPLKTIRPSFACIARAVHRHNATRVILAASSRREEK